MAGFFLKNAHWISKWMVRNDGLITTKCCVMPTSHRRHGQDKTNLCCLVRGVKGISDKSRLFSVALTAFRGWTKQFQNFVSPTVLTYRQFCSHRLQDKTIWSVLFVSAVRTRFNWKKAMWSYWPIGPPRLLSSFDLVLGEFETVTSSFTGECTN